jgi:FkbM family methyltransferase
MPVWLALASISNGIVDVGANLGTYGLAACAVNGGCRVVAYEPVPELAAFVRESAVDNGWSNRFTVREVALCDRTGELTFNSTGALGSMSSLDTGGFRGKVGETITVAAARLDNELGVGDHVDLVKIDVEGFEDQVLRGMPDVLERDRPTLMVECLPDGPYREVQQVLAARGYEFFHLTAEGPRRTAAITPDQRELNRNFVACARDDVRRVIDAFR